jgi:tyrosine-protein phosphatase YwqE
MGFFSNFFPNKSSKELPFNFLEADMHAHILPGIDDGSKNKEESLELIKGLLSLGYKKFIATPHIISDSYKNTTSSIRQATDELQIFLKENNVNVDITPSAEYYVDEAFLKLVEDNDLMPFGKNYILIETNYMFSSPLLKEAIFKLKIKGYKPIFAHPERYVYLYENFRKFEEIKELDILFQVNLASLMGYYSKESKIFAEKLIKNNMVDFVGTDIHNMRHLEVYRDAMQTKAYGLLRDLPLLNSTLL